ncbi:hypothetical protein [Wolbachia endosymbiont of Oedothorax gibbosus]|uniref:hypothetical protein n=1 Tax=Wolbachia endosymbiont of Oedothorax gibbosus TaxID=931100 RepID=UPI002024E687|nr:hypothetical protein [Wolbachia endosymbiont of Oedothorax gibbosus]
MPEKTTSKTTPNILKTSSATCGSNEVRAPPKRDELTTRIKYANKNHAAIQAANNKICPQITRNFFNL